MAHDTMALVAAPDWYPCRRGMAIECSHRIMGNHTLRIGSAADVARRLS